MKPLNMPDDETIENALTAIKKEYLRARSMFATINSKHEGVAIIREEYLELEQVVFTEHNEKARNEKSYTEAVQLGAMSLAFMLETD